ncbi:apolipoprotein N-acyltransferase [Tessaracoccus rhinocerotis]|uniref:Apolipoprotein N-acyltransferase n=1 Tax=Tessaracoccus rhinocerotis TaxID=1689449 RepID=A0A553JXW0_9ACTN|nr:apolipoprotein N-acyltransferase [Tessaracoccus rhinocerotis]TRY17283.1 apolipoprotein N-acyltransferase [Tessaracoccus rhinocerotis]
MSPLPTPGMTRLLSLPMAVVTGLLIGLGFAPMGVWPATLVGVALFTWLLAGRSAGSAAVHGLLAGLALNALTIHWISVLGVPVAVALVAFMSLWFLVLGIVVALLTRTRAWVFLVPAAWVGVETAAGSFPFGGFPWIRLAYTGLDQPIAGWFAWVGSAGVTFLLALGANLLLLAVVDRGLRLRATAGGLAVFLVGAALTLVPHAEPEQHVTVGVVQGNVNRAEKGTGTYARSVTANHLSETVFLLAEERARGGELDFILWPENATDIDPIADDTTREQIETAVRLAGVPIFVGAVMDGPVPDSRQTSSLWWHPETGPGDRYDKRNLVPFGEWIPFREFLLPRLPVLEQIGRQSIPGEGPGVVDAPTDAFEYLRVGTMICFELAWDSTSYDTVRGGAQVLVSQSNTNTYAGTFEVPQQTALNRIRALETGREVIVSTINGISGLVDVDGELSGTTEELTSAHRTFTVPLRTNTNLAVTLSPWLALVVSAAALGGTLYAVATRGGRRRPGRMDNSEQPIGSTQ